MQQRLGGALAQRAGRVQRADQAGRRLGMPDAALVGCQHQWRQVGGRAGAAAKHCSRRPNLNGVPQPRACAVQLQAAHLARPQACRGQRGAQHLLLRGAVGGGEAAAAAVLIDGAAGKEGEGPGRRFYAVGWQSEQQQRRERLGPHVAVRCCIERLAAAVGGQHAWWWLCGVVCVLGKVGPLRRCKLNVACARLPSP